MTKIPWTEKTLNVTAGCTKVSLGCQACYAEKMSHRLAHIYPKGIYGEVIREGPEGQHGKWNDDIICDGSALDKITPRQKPKMIFVNSMSDLFHKDVPFAFIEKVMAVIEECSQHTFQVLTKRPEIMLEYFNGLGKQFELSCCPNLWLGTSVENQKYADIRIPQLLQIPAAVRFLSIEPLLSPVDLTSSPSGDEVSFSTLLFPVQPCFPLLKSHSTTAFPKTKTGTRETIVKANSIGITLNFVPELLVGSITGIKTSFRFCLSGYFSAVLFR